MNSLTGDLPTYTMAISVDEFFSIFGLLPFRTHNPIQPTKNKKSAQPMHPTQRTTLA